jgi:hypothetical protein
VTIKAAPEFAKNSGEEVTHVRVIADMPNKNFLAEKRCALLTRNKATKANSSKNNAQNEKNGIGLNHNKILSDYSRYKPQPLLKARTHQALKRVGVVLRT